MPGNEREQMGRQLAVDDVQVGAANRAGAYPDQDVAAPRLRDRQARPAKRPAGRIEQHGVHLPAHGLACPAGIAACA
jgi:hypothetical protein